jgi:hypothetical protein
LVVVICFDLWMAKRVQVRRLNDAEGRQLQQIVRRGGKTDRSIVKWRRATVVLASAGGNDVAANGVELVFTPTYGSWDNPIEAHFGPLRQFVIANSDHRDHPALARAIRKYLGWRNTHTRDPKILEAERRHRAKLRSESQRRWGHPRTTAA